MGKIVTISNKNTNKCHKVVVTISDTYCSIYPHIRSERFSCFSTNSNWMFIQKGSSETPSNYYVLSAPRPPSALRSCQIKRSAELLQNMGLWNTVQIYTRESPRITIVPLHKVLKFWISSRMVESRNMLKYFKLHTSRGPSFRSLNLYILRRELPNFLFPSYGAAQGCQMAKFCSAA